MRLLQTTSKRANETIQHPIDFGDWLEQPDVSPGARPVSYAHTNSPDIVESATLQGDVYVLNLAGGNEGESYRIAVTATCANGLTRSVIVEVQVWGVRDDSGDGGSGEPGGAVNVEDSLTSDSQVNAPSVRSVNAALAGKVNVADGFTPTERAKLAGIATGATVNATDAALRDRALHTGQQAISTIISLQAELNARIQAILVGAPNGVASLGSDGKVPAAQLPSFSATEYLGDVANEAAMLAIVGGTPGDFCTRLDLQNTWIVIDTPTTLLSSWRQLAYPSSPVTSVAGKTGAVSLSKGDVGLAFVSNLAPADYPVSTAAANALALKSDVGHAHTTANVTGLDAALAGKAASSHVHDIANVNLLQAALDGKAPVAHTHGITAVLGLQTALDAKQNLLGISLQEVLQSGITRIEFGSGFSGSVAAGVLTLNVNGDSGYVDDGYVEPGYVSL